MAIGIEIHFNHPIMSEDEKKESELFVRVLGTASRIDNEVQHQFTITKNANCEDISEILEIVSPELYEEITEEIDIRISKYLEDYDAEAREDY
jgi:membrane protease subunit (stomatin/prohibitin family)